MIHICGEVRSGIGAYTTVIARISFATLYKMLADDPVAIEIHRTHLLAAVARATSRTKGAVHPQTGILSVASGTMGVSSISASFLLESSHLHVVAKSLGYNEAASASALVSKGADGSLLGWRRLGNVLLHKLWQDVPGDIVERVGHIIWR